MYNKIDNIFYPIFLPSYILVVKWPPPPHVTTPGMEGYQLSKQPSPNVKRYHKHPSNQKHTHPHSQREREREREIERERETERDRERAREIYPYDACKSMTKKEVGRKEGRVGNE